MSPVVNVIINGAVWTALIPAVVAVIGLVVSQRLRQPLIAALAATLGWMFSFVGISGDTPSIPPSDVNGWYFSSALFSFIVAVVVFSLQKNLQKSPARFWILWPVAALSNTLLVYAATYPLFDSIVEHLPTPSLYYAIICGMGVFAGFLQAWAALLPSRDLDADIATLQKRHRGQSFAVVQQAMLHVSIATATAATGASVLLAGSARYGQIALALAVVAGVLGVGLHFTKQVSSVATASSHWMLSMGAITLILGHVYADVSKPVFLCLATAFLVAVSLPRLFLRAFFLERVPLVAILCAAFCVGVPSVGALALSWQQSNTADTASDDTPDPYGAKY